MTRLEITGIPDNRGMRFYPHCYEEEKRQDLQNNCFRPVFLLDNMSDFAQIRIDISNKNCYV